MAKRKTKYEKVITDFWRCTNCNFEQAYVSVKCPICGSREFIHIR